MTNNSDDVRQITQKHKEPHPQPLAACGEGGKAQRGVVWGLDGIKVNLPDMVEQLTTDN